MIQVSVSYELTCTIVTNFFPLPNEDLLCHTHPLPKTLIIQFNLHLQMKQLYLPDYKIGSSKLVDNYMKTILNILCMLQITFYASSPKSSNYPFQMSSLEILLDHIISISSVREEPSLLPS